MKTDTIIYNCEVCGEPVAAGTGYIELDTRELARYRAAYSAWRKENPPGGVIDLAALISDVPARPKWHVWHGGCDPDPDHSGYWFAVERANDPWKLLDWCIHFAGKGYCEDTAWGEFVQRHTLIPRGVNA